MKVNIMKLPLYVVFIVLSFLKRGWNFDTKTRRSVLMSLKKLYLIKLHLSQILLYSSVDSDVMELSHQHVHRKLLQKITDILQSHSTGYVFHHKILPQVLNMSIYYMKRYSDPSNILDGSIIQKQKKIQNLLIKYGYKKRLIQY